MIDVLDDREKNARKDRQKIIMRSFDLQPGGYFEKYVVQSSKYEVF